MHLEASLSMHLSAAHKQLQTKTSSSQELNEVGLQVHLILKGV